MKRREFISTTCASVLVTWPLLASAQPRSAVPVIGFLSSRSADGSGQIVSAFQRGLNEAGYVDGRSVAIEYRWANFKNERLLALAADLVGQHVSVIVASATPSALAAKQATSSIAIVFVTGVDPVAADLVTSLNRPGANLTGISFLTNTIGSLQLQILHETVPTAKRIGLLVNPTNSVVSEPNVSDVEKAAASLGIRIDVLKASIESELDTVFATLAQQRTGALIVASDAFFNNRTKQLVALAARNALPAIYPLREFVEGGGLMSYGTSITEAYRQAGIYTGRILKGAQPSELPVMESTKVELVINLV